MSSRSGTIGSALLVAWTVGWLGLGGLEASSLHRLGRLLSSATPLYASGLLTLAAAWSLGHRFRRTLASDVLLSRPVDAALISLLVGLALLELCATLLAAAGLSLGQAGPVLLLAALLPSLPEAVRQCQSYRLPLRTSDQSEHDLELKRTVSLLLLPVLLAPVLSTLAPPTGPDEAQYHLRFLYRLLEEPGLPGSIDDPTSCFPLGLHVLASLPASLAGPEAARPFAFLLGLLSLLAAARVFVRLSRTGASWLYLGVVLGALTLLRTLPTFSTDLPLAALSAAVVLVLLDLHEDRTRSAESRLGHGLVLGLLGGLALSIKLSAPLFIAPYVAVFGVWLLWKSPVKRRRSLVLQLLLAGSLPLLVAGPWLLRTILEAGTPLYPLTAAVGSSTANDLFPFNFASHYGGGPGLKGLVSSPIELFLSGAEFDRRHYMGRFGIWPLVALPGLILALRSQPLLRPLFLATGIAYGLWGILLLRAVYLLPLWPLLALVAAIGLEQLLVRTGALHTSTKTSDSTPPVRRTSSLAWLLAVALVATAWVETSPALDGQLDDLPIAVGDRSQESAYSERVPTAQALKWLSDNSQPDEAVLALWAWHLGTLRNPVVWAGSEEFTPLRRELHRLQNTKALVAALRERNVRWVLLEEPRLLRSSFPYLSDQQWEVGFAAPLRLSEQFLRNEVILRYEEGPYRVFEIPASGEP